MKTKYNSGAYKIKIKGQDKKVIQLTQNQAKTLFELMRENYLGIKELELIENK